MDLQEEYFIRRKVPANIVKYPEHGSLILLSECGEQQLHVHLDLRAENNHPNFYHFVVSSNPSVHVSGDFSQFSYQHTKVLQDTRWEWDQYEAAIYEWAVKHRGKFRAVPAVDAVLVSWEMFVTRYDPWLANALPIRSTDHLHASLFETNKEFRLKCVAAVEEWLSRRHERVFASWRSLRQNLDGRAYADWLADIVNQDTDSLG